MKTAKALTLTYLTPVSFASLNGSDKETDNISNIKKISVGVEQFPYVSSQAVRRALRNQLEVLGRPLSEGVAASISKGAATTKQEPEKYIDDDLFGYMGTESAEGKAKGKATRRMTSQQICIHLCSSAFNISRFLLTHETKNHREHRVHREMQQTSVLSVVDYPCTPTSLIVQKCLNSFNNYIHQS